MSIIPVSLEKKAKNVSLLLYGYTGSGKTHLAGTAPKPLFLDFESGTATLTNLECEKCKRAYWLKKDGDCPHCSELGGQVFKVTDIASARSIFSVLETLANTRNITDEDKLKKAHDWVIKQIGYDLDFNIKTIVIDTISRMQEHESLDIIGKDGRRGDEDVMEMREWGILLTRVYRLMKVLPTEHYNVILVAQAREFEDPIDKKRKWMPNLRGQWGDQVGAYCDVVSYLEVKDVMSGPGKRETIRRLYFQPSGNFIAKSRWGKLPGYLDNPTFADIQSFIIGGGEK